MAKAKIVADYFIDKSRSAKGSNSEEYKSLSHLKLQKILYYAQGWHLGIYGRPLFNDTIYAWKFGPVVKSVYDELKTQGRANLSETIEPKSDFNFSDVTKNYLDQVWEQYGSETAGNLVDRTHLSDPFLIGFKNPFSDEISQKSMQEHFSQLA